MKEPKMPTPEEMAKIQKQRKLSDARLLDGGADIDFEGKIIATPEQIDDAKKTMNKELEMNQPQNIIEEKRLGELISLKESLDIELQAIKEHDPETRYSYLHNIPKLLENAATSYLLDRNQVSSLKAACLPFYDLRQIIEKTDDHNFLTTDSRYGVYDKIYAAKIIVDLLCELQSKKVSTVLSPEDMAKIQKQRILSDAELIKGGAEINSEGYVTATQEQIDDTKKTMNEQLEINQPQIIIEKKRFGELTSLKELLDGELQNNKKLEEGSVNSILAQLREAAQSSRFDKKQVLPLKKACELIYQSLQILDNENIGSRAFNKMYTAKNIVDLLLELQSKKVNPGLGEKN